MPGAAHEPLLTSQHPTPPRSAKEALSGATGPNRSTCHTSWRHVRPTGASPVDSGPELTRPRGARYKPWGHDRP
jgi:hypothetical protein